MAGIVLTFGLNNTGIANTLALVDGQANTPDQFSSLSLDLSGRIRDEDLRSGARLTWPAVYDHYVLFIDAQTTDGTREGIATGDEVEVSGRTGGGGGLYYTGLAPWRTFDITLRLSGQTEKLEVDSNIVVSGIQAVTTLRNRSVSAAMLFSPSTPISDNGTNYYLSIGASYHRSRRNVVLDGLSQQSFYRYDQDYVPYLAAGIVYPFKRINLYASTEYEGELSIGAGLRFRFSGTSSQ